MVTSWTRTPGWGVGVESARADLSRRVRCAFREEPQRRIRCRAIAATRSVSRASRASHPRVGLAAAPTAVPPLPAVGVGGGGFVAIAGRSCAGPATGGEDNYEDLTTSAYDGANETFFADRADVEGRASPPESPVRNCEGVGVAEDGACAGAAATGKGEDDAGAASAEAA